MAKLADYRTRITNSLDDSTSKYDNDLIDEALRKILNEYTRAYPNIREEDITVPTTGKRQSLTTCTNLIAIVHIIHPYQAALTDPYIYAREDYYLDFLDGVPFVFFFRDDIPQADEVMRVQFAGKQTIEDLDSASTTTVRDDHEDILVTGAVGKAAMIRASGLNEQWGGRSNEMASLMNWGFAQYNRFLGFLDEIKSEPTFPIMPASYWALDDWDK